MFIKSNGGHTYALIARDEKFGLAVYPRVTQIKGHLVLMMQFRIHTWGAGQVPKELTPPKFREAQIAYRGYSHTALFFLSTGIKSTAVNALTPALVTHMILAETRKNFLVPNTILSNMSLHQDAEADLGKMLHNLLSDFMVTDLVLSNTGILMQREAYETWVTGLEVDKSKFKLVVTPNGASQNTDDADDDEPAMTNGGDPAEPQDPDQDGEDAQGDSIGSEVPSDGDEPAYVPTATVVSFPAAKEVT